MLDFIIDFSKQLFGGYAGDRVIRAGIRTLDAEKEAANRRALKDQIGSQVYKIGGAPMTYDEMVLFAPERADMIEEHILSIADGAFAKARAMQERRQELLFL